MSSVSCEEIVSTIDRVCAQQLADTAARLSGLSIKGDFRRFLVSRVGSTGSAWLAKVLNSHPDVYCSHEALLTHVYPRDRIGSADVLDFIEHLAGDTKHGAYRAVGDVGSVWAGHLACLGVIQTAILVRHPARVLHTRLQVFPPDPSFAAIPEESRICIREILGIDLGDLPLIDRFFVHDVFTFASQVWALGKIHLVVRIEDMRDVVQCQATLKTLTGLDYDRALVEPAVGNRVNSRSAGHAEIAAIVAGFSAQQQEWYRLVLGDVAPRFGYGLLAETADAPA